MSSQITVRDMLEQMETGLPFSIAYVTYDAQRRKGGQIVRYEEAQLLQADEDQEGRPRTRLEEARHRTIQIKEKRDPRHQRWYTRNIRILQAGHKTSLIKKIHPPLVFLFNDQIVVA